MAKKWTKEEEEFIKANYKKYSNKELAEKFGVTESAIQSKLSKMGLTRQKQKKWTKEDEEFLKGNYMNMTDEELAEKLNVTPIAIKRKLNRMGLKRNAVIGYKTTTKEAVSKSENIIKTDAVSSTEAITYKPTLSYRVGDKIFHSVFEKQGEVIEKTKTKGGHLAILVRFEDGSEKLLVEKWVRD